MNNYDFSNLKCIYEKEEIIPIEEEIKNNSENMSKYNNVTGVKYTIKKYQLNSKTIVTRKVKTYILKQHKDVIARQKNWKPFGKAAISNVGCTSIGDEVFMQNTYNDPFSKKEEIDKRLLESIKKQLMKEKTKKAQAYQPKMKNKKEDSNFSFKDSGYIPPVIKNKIDNNIELEKEPENFSIIVKNLPIQLTEEEIYDNLYYYFEVFGKIRKINILKDKFNPNKIRDMAFIDFFNYKDAVEALKCKKRILIGNCIVIKEKATSRKKN